MRVVLSRSLPRARAGLRAGEPVLFVGFHETRHQLLLKADPFWLGPELRAALAPGGRLTLLREPPVELDADVLADGLLTALDQTGARRLVVDSIAEVERAANDAGDARRVANYLAALVEVLQAHGITTLFTKENDTMAAAELALSADLISVVAANRDDTQGTTPHPQGAIRSQRVVRQGRRSPTARTGPP